MTRRGVTLVSVFIVVGVTLIACAKPFHEESERYVFVATIQSSSRSKKSHDPSRNLSVFSPHILAYN